MFLDCLHCIRRAGGRKPTGRKSERRYANPVEIDRKQEEEGKEFPQELRYGYPDAEHPGETGFHKDSFSEMRKRAVFTFSSNSAVAVSRSDR